MLAGFGAISLSILFFFILYRYRGFGDAISNLIYILMPFVYGAVIAYLLKPVCNCLDRFFSYLLPKHHRITNMLAVIATILFGLLTVYAILILIIPQVVNSIITLSSTLREKTDVLMNWAMGYFSNNEILLNYIETIYETISDTFNDWVRDTLMPYMRDVVSGVGLGVWNAVITLKNLLVGVVVAVYLLAGRKKFARQANMILHSLVKSDWADLILEELSYADKMFGGFINGKILDSAIIGLLCYIGCMIFKFPNAILISVIIGVTNIIPFFGPFIGAIPATLLVFIENPIKAVWFILFVLVLQQLDGNIIGPKILGNVTGLSSFWVMFAILLFGGLWGFVGMLIGVPLFAVIYDVTKKLVFRGLRRNKCDQMLTDYHDTFGDPDDNVVAAAESTDTPPAQS
jgi:predicted PurR-regulated permease PerM